MPQGLQWHVYNKNSLGFLALLHRKKVPKKHEETMRRSHGSNKTTSQRPANVLAISVQTEEMPNLPHLIRRNDVLKQCSENTAS